MNQIQASELEFLIDNPSDTLQIDYLNAKFSH